MAPNSRRSNDNGGCRFRLLLVAFMLQNAFVAVLLSNREDSVFNLSRQAMEFVTLPTFAAGDSNVISDIDDANATNESDESDQKLKIAVVSSYVRKDTKPSTRSELRNKYKFLENHMLNHACYSHIWNYDFIFNNTWGFDPHERSIDEDPTKGAHWLNYGMWNRIPHILAALDRGYDWVLFVDNEYLFQDMKTPIESFLKEWELHGLHNVHIFLPDDDQPDGFEFSAFAMLFRNSDFSRSVLKHWKNFSLGLCPNGNFPGKPGYYKWYHGDQPGLWYALTQAHSDMYHNGTEKEYQFKCDPTTGYLDADSYMSRDLNNHMTSTRVIKDVDLRKLPKDQPIVWSNTRDGRRGGLGVQQEMGNWKGRDDSHAYAIHRRADLPPNVMADLDRCRKHYGCVATEAEADGLMAIRCGNDSERHIETNEGVKVGSRVTQNEHDEVNSSSKKPQGGDRFAYAFLLAGCDPDEPYSYRPYLYNVLISAHILQSHASQADVIVMVQLSESYVKRQLGSAQAVQVHHLTLPQADLDLIHKLNAKHKSSSATAPRIRIKYLPTPIRDNFYTAQLEKFRILQFTEYKRVLYLDADVMPLCNLDYLLAESKSNVVLAWNKEPAQGGAFALEPKPGAYERLQKIIARRERQVLAMDADPKMKDMNWRDDIGWSGCRDDIDDDPNGQCRPDLETTISATDPWYGLSQNNGTDWAFHGNYCDQGLLYYWTKYVLRDVWIIHFDRVDEWGSERNVPKLLKSMTESKHPFLSHTCLPPGMENRGNYGSSMLSKMNGKVPHRDFIHFTGKQKPWERPAPADVKKTATSSVEYWYQVLHEVQTMLGVDYDLAEELSRIKGLSGEEPRLGRYPTLPSMIETVRAKEVMRQSMAKQKSGSRR